MEHRHNNLCNDDKSPRYQRVFHINNYFIRIINYAKTKAMDWIKANLRQTLIIALITMVFSTIGSIFVYSFTSREEKLGKAASIEYVNDRDAELNSKLCLHDEHFIRLEDQIDTKADKVDMIAVQATVNDIYKLLLAMATEKQLKQAEVK